MHCASLERMVVWTGLVILGISVIARALPARAAEESPAAPAAAAKAEAPAPAAKPAARRGAAREGQPRQPAARLPNYYGEIVTEEQREKILAIQRQFAAKIDPLRLEVEKLTRERDAQIESLLTPEQKKKLDEKRAAAKAKRDANRPPRSGKSGRSSRTPAAGGSAPAAPPAR